MFTTIKADLAELKHYPAGARFQRFHEHHHGQQSGWARAAMVAAAVLSFAIGVVLVFIPGPAVVFFAITAALLGMQSRWVAKHFDRGELAARKLLRRLRAKRRRAERARH